MLLAQISDLHVVAKGKRLYESIDTPAFLARAVAHLNGLDPRPDFVWITGDLVDQGSAAEYAHLRELLRPLQLPRALIPGTPDARAPRPRPSPAHPSRAHPADFLKSVPAALPLRLIALDPLIPGESGGRLCQARLDWLSDRLEERPDRPTVIAMH